MIQSVTFFVNYRHMGISYKKHNHEKTNAFFFGNAFYSM